MLAKSVVNCPGAGCFLERVVEASASENALKAAAQALGATPGDPEAEHRAGVALTDLIRIAQADGDIHADVTVADHREAYGAIYGSSRERTAALDGWLWTYNHRRPHGSLRHRPPIARLSERNNLPGHYI